EFVQANVAPYGQVLRMTGGSPSNPPVYEFNKPLGMLLDTDDTPGRNNLLRIHVVDSLNNRIQRFLVKPSPVTQFPDSVFVMLTKTSGDVADTTLDATFNKNQSMQVMLDPVYLSNTQGKANSFMLSPFIWGGLGFAQGLLNNPSCLAKDENSILWVTDTENGRVQGFYVTPSNAATDATFYREFGNDINLPYGAGRLSSPTAIAYDNSGFGGFLVLDKLQTGGYNIQKFDRDGHFIGVFATSGDKEGQLKQPVSIAINPFDNTAFITDRARKKVMVYNNKGEFVYEFGGDELADPRGVTVLRNNYVYVTDAVKNMVYRYVPQ
ncbi:MAG: NHL repeat-containing protein, partial [Nitrospirota bacterium]